MTGYNITMKIIGTVIDFFDQDSWNSLLEQCIVNPSASMINDGIFKPLESMDSA